MVKPRPLIQHERKYENYSNGLFYFSAVAICIAPFYRPLSYVAMFSRGAYLIAHHIHDLGKLGKWSNYIADAEVALERLPLRWPTYHIRKEELSYSETRAFSVFCCTALEIAALFHFTFYLQPILQYNFDFNSLGIYLAAETLNFVCKTQLERDLLDREVHFSDLKIERVQEQRNAAEDRADTMAALYNANGDAATELRGQVHELQEQVDDLEDEVDGLRLENDTLRSDNDDFGKWVHRLVTGAPMPYVELRGQ